MRSKYSAFLPFILVICVYSHAQLWSGILDPSRAIDWSAAGVPGGIPNRTTVCATLQASTFGNGTSDATSGIQTALNGCPANQVVVLSAGTFRINGSLSVPSNVTLRGAGADQTKLDLHGSSNGAVNLGSGDPNASNAVLITSGSTAGSTSLVLVNSGNVSVGGYLLITELNTTYVSIIGDEGACKWCDTFWNGTRARGQIVEVTSKSGNTVGITPALYSTFLLTPQAVPFSASAKNAGVESLQVFANHTGYTANFLLRMCAYCWVKGVEGNYADGDHVQVHWGFHDEIRDSYFSNAYGHSPGTTDSDVFIVDKTSATLVENNILDRLHLSIILNWGAAGNVIAYNYMTGNFDQNSANAVYTNLSMHGAHPQFNLIEGNVGAQLYPDSVWGSSSHNTAYRNWMTGTTMVCNPLSGRGVVDCTGSNGHWAFQAARAVQIASLSTSFNFVGNVVGSASQAGLKNLNKNPLPQIALLQWPSTRQYEYAYGWTFGYSNLSDDGSNGLDNVNPFNTSFLHGNYNNVDGSLIWANGITHTLPASFFRSSQPAYWGSAPWPAIGPEVSGGSGPGGHASPIPAQACYSQIGGSEGGGGSPRTFNADTCYGTGGNPQPPEGLVAVPH
jgi:hypothetical protein